MGWIPHSTTTSHLNHTMSTQKCREVLQRYVETQRDLEFKNYIHPTESSCSCLAAVIRRDMKKIVVLKVQEDREKTVYNMQTGHLDKLKNSCNHIEHTLNCCLLSEFGTFYLVREFEYANMGDLIDMWNHLFAGGTIQDFGSNAPKPQEMLLDAMLAVSVVLAILHDKNIVHRDPKPENTLVHMGPDGKAEYTLTDFDFATSLPDDDFSPNQKRFGSYISPERERIAYLYKQNLRVQHRRRVLQMHQGNHAVWADRLEELRKDLEENNKEMESIVNEMDCTKEDMYHYGKSFFALVMAVSRISVDPVHVKIMQQLKQHIQLKLLSTHPPDRCSAEENCQVLRQLKETLSSSNCPALPTVCKRQRPQSSDADAVSGSKKQCCCTVNKENWASHECGSTT